MGPHHPSWPADPTGPHLASYLAECSPARSLNLARPVAQRPLSARPLNPLPQGLCCACLCTKLTIRPVVVAPNLEICLRGVIPLGDPYHLCHERLGFNKMNASPLGRCLNSTRRAARVLVMLRSRYRREKHSGGAWSPRPPSCPIPSPGCAPQPARR